MKKNTNTTYEQLKQQKMRDDAVLENMQESNENGTPYKYTEEQMLKAQSQPAKKEINELYNNRIFPTSNNILYVVYYIFSLIIIPLLYFNENTYKAIVGVGAWVLLIITLIVINRVEKSYHRDMVKQHKCIEYINNFANNTSIFCYILTSFGYFGCFLCKKVFLTIYIIMLFLFIYGFIYNIIKPLWSELRKHKIS